jgi:multicomponent Na+:H+ antiporter subunit D
MRRTETISLDTDWLWRVALFRGVTAVQALLQRAAALLGRGADFVLARAGGKARAWFGGTPEDDGRPHGVFARAWPIGTTALWIAVLLTAYVFFYYLA